MRNNRFRKLLAAPGPSTALQELLYGFIMALIFVYAARFGILKYDAPWDFIIVIIGMNATWGAIDAAIFYYLGLCDQKRYIKLIKDDSADPESRISELMDEFDSTPLDVLSDQDKRWVCEKMLDRELQSEDGFSEDRRKMMISSVGCFVITLLTVIPIIIPVLLISDFMTALRVASVLAAIILFFIGYYMAPYLGLNRWVTGATLTGMSLLISLISTFTGG